MKTIRLTLLFVLCPLFFYAQTLTGLWIGSVKNDSATSRKDQSFEIVLTQYKDKVYGFSRSTFIVNDSLFYIVKRVKGTIDGDVCEVKDDEIVSYNFHGRLDKGVKMVSIFRFDHEDSVWRMDGDWKTNKTKKYYAVSGKIALAQEKDLEKSKIFPHLEELNLAKDVEFYKESKKQTQSVAAAKQVDKLAVPGPNESVAKIPIRSEQAPSTPKKVTADVTNDSPAKVALQKNAQATTPKSQAAPGNTATLPNERDQNIASKKSDTTTLTRRPIAEVKQPATNNVIAKSSVSQAESKPTVLPNTRTDNSNLLKDEKQTSKKPDAVATTTVVKPNSQANISKSEPISSAMTSTTTTPEKPQPVSLFTNATPEVTTNAAVFVAERKVTVPQIVDFRSDSLELALYDNGEIDGDTVSVLLNGQIILARQGLKASAIKKTIYVPAGKADSLTLVLYAENLGKYPPNTGLLIVHDGEETYQIRFSADLQQNAAVIFRRKKD